MRIIHKLTYYLSSCLNFRFLKDKSEKLIFQSHFSEENFETATQAILSREKYFLASHLF